VFADLCPSFPYYSATSTLHPRSFFTLSLRILGSLYFTFFETDQTRLFVSATVPLPQDLAPYADSVPLRRDAGPSPLLSVPQSPVFSCLEPAHLGNAAPLLRSFLRATLLKAKAPKFASGPPYRVKQPVGKADPGNADRAFALSS